MRALWAILLWPCGLMAKGESLPTNLAKPKPEGLTLIDQETHDPRLKGYHTPHGFKLEIVAEKATLTNPVLMTFATDGTLYVIERTPDVEVAETTSTIHYKDGTRRTVRLPNKKTNDLVKKLTYDVAKGRFNQAIPILEDQFPTNILVHDGWLYLAGRGAIRRWALSELADGKNPNAKPKQVAHGWAAQSSISMNIGPDGWLIITCGVGDHVVEGADGSRATVLHSGGVFRCRLDGSALEVVAQGLAQSSGSLAHDDRGHAFYLDQAGDDGRLLHVVDGSDFGWRSRGDQRTMTSEQAGTLSPILNTGRGSPAGLHFYNDQQLPPFYRRWLYSPDTLRRMIRAWKPVAVGSTIEVVNEFPLLNSDDPHFCPRQIITGPDGALYVLDTRTPADRLGSPINYRQHGRLYRLTWAGGNVPDDPEPHDRIDLRPMDTWNKLASANIDALLESLQGAEGTLRVLAQRELLRRQEADLVQGHFVRLATDAEQSVETRLLCFGAFYTRWDAKARETVIQHLHDQEPLISEICADLLGRMVTAREEEAVRALDKLLADPHQGVRRRAALALGRINGSGTIDALMANYRADDGKEALLTNGLIRAIERTGKAGITKLLELARSGNDGEREKCVQAFLALRTKAGAELLPELLGDPHLSTEQQVALVKSFAHYRFVPPLSLESLPALLKTHKLPTTVQAAALTLLADVRQVNQAGSLELVKSVLNDDQPVLHLAVVQAIDSAEWIDALPLLRPLLDEQRGLELRAATVRAMRHGAKEHAAMVAGLAKPTEPAVVRIEALRTLAILDSKMAFTVASESLKDKDLAVLREALTVLSSTHEGAVLVAEKLVRGALPRELVPLVAEGLRRQVQNANDRQRLTAVMKSGLLETNNLGEVEKVRQLVLTKGDASRGRALYLHANTLGCVRCHTLEGVGGSVGPDVTKLWDTGSVEKIIAALLEPSQHIREGFATVKLMTKEQTLLGRLITDTKDEVVLRNAQGQDVRVPRAAIVKQEPSPRSLMPDDLASQLSFEQFIDVVAFLKNRSAQESLRGIVTQYRVAKSFDAERLPEQGGRADWQPSMAANGEWDITEAKPAYATFVAQATKATPTTLYLTSNDAVRMWVNGKLVFDRTRLMTDSLSEERIVVDLQAGTNDILLRTEGPTKRRLTVRVAMSEGLRLNPMR